MLLSSKMSKKYRNHIAAQSRCSSSDEICVSDDEVCIIDEISPKSSRDNCHSVIALTDSENEITMKRRYKECSNDSDSESESNKYLSMKKSRSEFYESGNNEQRDKPEELFVIDKKSQPLVEDEFHRCEVCNLSLITRDLYRKHMNSRDHKEAMKRMVARRKSAANERDSEVNGHGSESSRVSDRYPPVPFGMRRLKIRDESFIQQEVEKIKACPGLEHVTEIRGQKDTSYFCSTCDKSFYDKKDIISHLKNDKHKVKSLKALKPEWYGFLGTIPKRERKQHLHNMLSSIQVAEGIGKIVVERDCCDADNYKAIQNLDIPGTNSDSESVIYCSDANSSLVLSDSSKNDYFCWRCECYMFDTELWDSHAKKRSKSLRKYSAGKGPKIEIKKRPKMDAFLIAGVTIPNAEPMVGLDYIREFQHVDVKKETYHCLLCGDCLSCIDITQHIASLYHRKKYLEYINHYSLDYVNSFTSNKNKLFYSVEEICRTIQSDFGSGCPEVYVIKNLKET